MVIEAAIALASSVVALLVVVFNMGRWAGKHETLQLALASLADKVEASDKAIEAKLVAAIVAEVKRNDDITSLIAANTKDIASVMLVLVQRVTVAETCIKKYEKVDELVDDLAIKVMHVQTVCDECIGRTARHCGEEEVSKKGE